MIRRLLLTLLLLAIVAPSLGGSIVVVRRAAAPPAEPYHFLDDFEADSAADWTEFGSWIGQVTINGGSSGKFVTTAATGSSIYNPDPMGTAAGYICMKLAAEPDYPGIKFRASSGDSTSSYVFRCNAGSGIAWRLCDVASCTDIASNGAIDCTNGYAMGLVYQGAGDSTIIDYYTFSDGVCPNCSASDCDTSTWAGSATQSGQFLTDPDSICSGSGSPRAACTGSGALNGYMDTQRYVGLYSGNAGSGNSFEYYYAGDD